MQSTLKSRSGQVAQHWRGVLPVHDACDLLPAMSDAELLELGEDIKRHNLHTPVVIFTDQHGTEFLLDGRNRLNAMEIVGLPVVIDGELNPAIVHKISGNVDPIAWVLSANILRRHLTREQKDDLTAKLIKAQPGQSNRTIAKQVKRDHKTVGKVRDKLEARGEIPHAEDSTDTKGRKQPAKKTSSTKAAVPKAPKPVAKEPEAQEPKQVHSIAATLDYHFNALLALCGDASKWSEPSAGRKARRIKALKKLRTAWSELVELAKPAPRRGRRAKGAKA